MDNTEKIIKAFEKSSNPLKSAEIADSTGIDKKEVDKILKKLKQEEKIFSPKMCFYAIKK